MREVKLELQPGSHQLKVDGQLWAEKTLHQGQVLLAGWCEGRSSFEPGPVFSVRGKARN